MLSRLIGLTVLALALSATCPARAGEAPRISLATIFSALDSDPAVPTAWGGIWDTDIDTRICDNPLVLFTSSFVDTLCPGTEVDPGAGDPGSVTNCTGTATDASINMTCTYAQEVTPGCMLNATVDYVSTRNGDSFSTNMRIQSTYTGDCTDVEDSCIEMDITGTRIGPAPADCAVPVDRVTWGTVKSRYE